MIDPNSTINRAAVRVAVQRAVILWTLIGLVLRQACLRVSAPCTAFLLVAALTVNGAVADSRDPETHFFLPTFGDLVEEAELLQEENKVALLVMFELTDCPWCERMKQTIFNRVDVQDYYGEHFRVIRLDVEGDNEVINFSGEPLPEKEFASKHNRIRATPAFVFFDHTGAVLARYTGATKDASEFLMLGEYVVDGHYANQSFTRFKRDRQKQAAGG